MYNDLQLITENRAKAMNHASGYGATMGAVHMRTHS